MPTGGSLKVTSTGVITTNPMKISFFAWAGSGSVGDALVLVDSGGKDVWRAVAQSASYDLTLSWGERGRDILGLNLTTLTSGTLTIYYL